MINRKPVSKWMSFAVAMLFMASALQASANMNLAQQPLFLTSVPPIVMVMLDNSGSMTIEMYGGSFNSSVSYHGIFDATKNYEYDGSIPVNTGAYTVAADTNAKGAFVESTCTPSAGDSICWSGNFLNWLTTRRIDSTRQVLVGGKLESETAFNYGTDLNYKVLANNEYSDRNFTKSSGVSASYSPITNNSSTLVSSPAYANGGNKQTSYDPYAKIYASAAQRIYDSAGTAVGEFGSVDATDAWVTVNLMGVYTKPVVVATAPSFNGPDPGVVRIRNVSPGDKTFQVSFQEWPYRDVAHTTERISYVVMEAGTHTLPDSMKVKAETVDTNKVIDFAGCSTTPTVNYASPSFVAGFSSTPVVIASPMTVNGTDAVTARIWDVTSTEFKLALQEEEKGGLHATETVGYIALTKGNADDVTNGWSVEVGTQSSVTASTATITFASPGSNVAPTFVAGMQTKNENDPGTIRTDTLTAAKAVVHIQEEASCDAEVAHAGETVGYAAFWGRPAFNIALALKDKPTGLLHDIDGKVRLGVSFYRFPPDKADIYNGVTTDGGTLNFKIPKNPFVKKPTDTSLPVAEQGYRELSGYVGTNLSTISDAIQHYPSIWGTTPIAENLWEVIQYFEQDNPHYAAVEAGFPDFVKADADGDGTPETPANDPFYYPDFGQKLQCAAPNVVIFTDGEPYRDAGIPSAIVDYDEDSNPNDDTSASNLEDNLDDVAYWGFCDKGAAGACPDSNGDGSISKDDKGTRDLRADIEGKQFLRTYTVGFAGGTIAQVLQDTADNAGGSAHAAADGASLKTALSTAFSDAIAASSAAAVSLDAGAISTDTTLYQARFDGTEWTGEVLAYKLNADGSLPGSPAWNAADNMPAESARDIFTFDGSSGVAFEWANLTVSQKAALNDDSNVLEYLRGVPVSGFRTRKSLLGDIVHSSPLYVGAPNLPYPDDWLGTSSEPEDSVPYSSFANNTTYKNRTPVVYAGANDGMMHAFNADTGVEMFAYVPNEIFGNLANLASPSYAHRYFVDGPPTVLDAFFGGAWHSVLVGGLGAGGQGVYALDVSSPGSFSASNVLWEFTDEDDPDMGYSFSRPNIVRMTSGRTSSATKWAAVFGNGYDNRHADGPVSATGNAVLFIIDIETGDVIKKIDTGVGDTTSPNGLSTVAPVDVDGDYVVDYIYGGDLYGNLWKFDVTATNPNSWSATRLFTACAGADCTAAPRQPITSRPQVGLHPTGQGLMIYFGTGKYVESGDDSPTGQTTQTFYGVWDNGYPSFDRDHLLKQEIVTEITESGFNYRVVSNNPIKWHEDKATLPTGSPPTTHLGWYLDLVNTGVSPLDNKGERQVSDSILRTDRIIFTTLVPSEEACDSGGTSWLMELSIQNGGQLPYTPFDVNGDTVFSEQDWVEVDVDGDGTLDLVPVSGRQSTVGITPSPGILSLPAEGKELKYTSGSTGQLETTLENPGPLDSSRRSWRQLR